MLREPVPAEQVDAEEMGRSRPLIALLRAASRAWFLGRCLYLLFHGAFSVEGFCVWAGVRPPALVFLLQKKNSHTGR